MLGIEDVASYSDFFSPEEWDAIQTGDWSQVPYEDWGDSTATEEVSSGVTTDGSDCAAQRDQVAPEDQPSRTNRAHTVVVVARNGPIEGRYELECEACGHLGAAGSFEEAHAVERLHEEFVAVLVDRWAVS